MAAVVFFGGNGHCAARLSLARAALERIAAEDGRPRLELVDVPYPGFEGRPAARDAAALLSSMVSSLAPMEGRDDVTVYATGIGALLALTVRVRGRLVGAPMILQGPVLWGLERRWMPRLARAGLAGLVPRLFAWPAFQRRFVRQAFVTPPPPDLRAAFFDGYARCAAAADLFRWCGPSWLRGLEASAPPERLRPIEVWWGGRDRIVGVEELRWTEEALGVRWPTRTFAGWGHYPMIDDPGGWARALALTAREPARL